MASFEGPLFHWRGPSPFHFVRVAPEWSEALRRAASLTSYGWGVVPVRVRVGATEWSTSLFPKDGGYLLPIKDAVRKAEQLQIGDVVGVVLEVEPRGWTRRRG